MTPGRDRRGRTSLTEAEREVYSARVRKAEAVPDLSSSHRLVLIQMAKVAIRGICFASQEELRRRACLKSVRTVGRAWVVLTARGLIRPQVVSVVRTRAWAVLPSVGTGQFVRSAQTKCRNETGHNVRQSKDRNTEELPHRVPQPIPGELDDAARATLASQMRDLVASLATAKRTVDSRPTWPPMKRYQGGG